MTNGHTKRSATATRPTLKLRISRSAVPKKPKESGSEASDSEASTESESSGSVPVRRTRARKTVPSVSADSDSGEVYTPSGRGKQTRKNRAKNTRNSKQVKSKSKLNFYENSKNDKYEEDEAFSANELSDEESEEEVINRSRTRSQKLASTPDHNESLKNTTKSGRNNIESQSEEEEEEEEEDEEEEEQSQNEINNQDSDSEESDKGFVSSRSQRRIRGTREIQNQETVQNSRRTGKRPHYNEESDESNTMPVRNRRKIKRRYYAEESDESPEPENVPRISISSRGRVRKMTERARAFLLDSP